MSQKGSENNSVRETSSTCIPQDEKGIIKIYSKALFPRQGFKGTPLCSEVKPPKVQRSEVICLRVQSGMKYTCNVSLEPWIPSVPSNHIWSSFYTSVFYRNLNTDISGAIRDVQTQW